jgi:hypothetical protein
MTDKNIPYVPYCKIVHKDEAKRAFENGFKIFCYWKAKKYYEDTAYQYRKAKVRLLNRTVTFEQNLQKIKVLEFPVFGDYVFYQSPDKYEMKQPIQPITQPTLF